MRLRKKEIKMKTERESFDLWFKKNFHDLHEAICCGDLVAKNYKKSMFKAWQASAQREGYKIMPVEPTDKMIAHMINTPIEVNLLCDHADTFLSEGEAYIAYKAMIGASE